MYFCNFTIRNFVQAVQNMHYVLLSYVDIADVFRAGMVSNITAHGKARNTAVPNVINQIAPCHWHIICNK